jgi:competence protein ComEC
MTISAGARSLLGAFPVGELLTSVPERLAEFRSRTCAAGQQWEWDGVVFRVLGPSTMASNANDNSCVLKVDGAGGSVLLTGDIEAGGKRL